MTKLLFFLLFFIIKTQSQPVFVQQLFRHGSRYPIYSGLGDDIAYSNGKLGELTYVGKRAQYLLGQKLYNEYAAYLNLVTIDPNLIYVKSTNYNRTIESIKSQLLGWFQNLPQLSIGASSIPFSTPSWINTTIVPISGPIFQLSPAFHTFPIHIELTGANGLRPGDFLVQYSSANCPNQVNWKIENLKGAFNKDFTNNPRLVAVKQKLTDAFNQTSLISDNTAANYLDNYICSQVLNLLNLSDPKVKVITDNYNQLCNFIVNLDQIYKIAPLRDLFLTPLQKNVTATPFLQQTLQNIQNFIKNPNSAHRLILYSAHDTTMLNMLAALNFTSAECIYEIFLNNVTNPKCINIFPKFTSNLIFELNNNTNNYTIKIRYNGQYKQIPFCGYNTQCTISQFQTFVQQTVRPNYLQDCGIVLSVPAQQSSNVIYIAFIAVLGGLSLIMLGYELYLYLKKKITSSRVTETTQLTNVSINE